jgi:hypothetical protein
MRQIYCPRSSILCRLQETFPPMTIQSLRVFGSFVRGEHDCRSDYDILAVKENWSADNEQEILTLTPPPLRPKASIFWYGPSRIKDMFAVGDLFAWHLFLESKKICSAADLIDRIGRPSDYTQAEETFDIFFSLLDSVGERIKTETYAPVYEAGLLYASARNIAMALSWYAPGGLCFSRYSPSRVSKQIGIRFPLTSVEYELLVSCRIAGQRGGSISDPGRASLSRQWDLLREWADELRRKLCGAK